MDLTSEQVHWIGGVAFVTVSLLMLVRASSLWRWQWIPWLLPALFVGYGQTLTYRISTARLRGSRSRTAPWAAEHCGVLPP